MPAEPYKVAKWTGSYRKEVEREKREDQLKGRGGGEGKRVWDIRLCQDQCLLSNFALCLGLSFFYFYYLMTNEVPTRV